MYYDYTPYAYVYNNPIKLIDQFGLDSTFYNAAGTKIYSSGDDPKSNANFVVKTSQNTDTMYKDIPDKPEKGNSNPISSADADKTERDLANGNTTGEHMINLVEIPNNTAGRNVLRTIKDDGNGGT